MKLRIALFAIGMAALALLAAGCAQQGDQARVSLREWKLEIKDTQRPSGEVVFLVSNNGAMRHILRIEGPGVRKQTREIEPGGNDVLSVRLERGTYDLFCPILQHRERGIAVKLQVGQPQQ
ncbi:MAG: hypothetical protein AAB502_00195 [Chloroflexota bacterium]